MKVAILLAARGDVVLDEYSTLFEKTQKPTFNLVLEILRPTPRRTLCEVSH